VRFTRNYSVLNSLQGASLNIKGFNQDLESVYNTTSLKMSSWRSWNLFVTTLSVQKSWYKDPFFFGKSGVECLWALGPETQWYSLIE